MNYNVVCDLYNILRNVFYMSLTSEITQAKVND